MRTRRYASVYEIKTARYLSAVKREDELMNTDFHRYARDNAIERDGLKNIN